MDITVTFDGVADPDYAAHLLADGMTVEELHPLDDLDVIDDEVTEFNLVEVCNVDDLT